MTDTEVLDLAVPLARRYRHRLVDNAVTLDDLTQVAALALVRAARCYKHGTGDLRGWAWTRADYEVRRYLRDMIPGARWGRSLDTVSLDAPVPGSDTVMFGDVVADEPAERVYATTVDRIALKGALERLLPRRRAALIATVALEASQREVAPMLGVSQMTVSMWVRSALRELAAAPELAA